MLIRRKKITIRFRIFFIPLGQLLGSAKNVTNFPDYIISKHLRIEVVFTKSLFVSLWRLFGEISKRTVVYVKLSSLGNINENSQALLSSTTERTIKLQPCTYKLYGKVRRKFNFTTICHRFQKFFIYYGIF